MHERAGFEVTASGWQILPVSPAKFQRKKGMGALPIPEHGGDIEQLRRFTNLSDADFALFVSVLADALCSGRPHVVLNLIGESGSGKTTAARIARSLTDPSDVPAGTLPREARDLFIDVSGSHVLAYDNVGLIPKHISDALCQVTSGTGYRKRMLYSDTGQVLIGGYRTVVLTGVHNAVTEPDLAERCLTMNLSHIDPSSKKSDVKLRRDFERARPQIFGALLDIVSFGLKRLPHTHVPELPRLADFALFGVAIEQAFAPAGAFLAAFTASQMAAVEAVVEKDPVTTVVAAFMQGRNAWDGTTTQFLQELEARDPTEAKVTKTKGWPREASTFGIALKKAKQVLRKLGIEVHKDRATDRNRTPMLHLRTIKQEEKSAKVIPFRAE